MPHHPFLPPTDAAKPAWLDNLANKLMNAANGYATKYNVPAATITQLDTGRKWVNAVMADITAMSTAAQALTAFKNQLFSGSGPITPPAAPVFPAAPAVAPFAGVFTLASSVCNQIKASSIYSLADGQDMGTEGAAIVTPAIVPAPVLKLVSSVAGSVTIEFQKDSHTGVKVQSRAPGTLAWADVGMFTTPRFHDTRPLATAGAPEVREYRACFMDKDIPSNVWGAILSVTVTP